MKKSTKIIMASLLALGVSGGVFAYGAHNHWGMNADEKAEFVTNRVSKKLDLDETQRQNLEVLAKDMLALMEEMRNSRQAHMNEIQQMLGDSVLDQNRALKMIQDKTQVINDKAPAAIASLALFLDSLDAEQKSELQSFVADRMHRRHKH